MTTWALNVESDFCSDWSSPTSESTTSTSPRREPSLAGIGRPERSIAAANPSALSATVLPPALGPLTISAWPAATRMSLGTTAGAVPLEVVEGEQGVPEAEEIGEERGAHRGVGVVRLLGEIQP